MIDFPNTPTIGQIFTTGGLSWTWDGSKWNMSATAGGPYVPLSGGTMTGPLVLSQDPVAPLGAATKNYVDDAVAGDNRIINGDMRIDQRNNGAAITAGGYLVDRWILAATAAIVGKTYMAASSFWRWARRGFPYALYWTTTTAYTPVAADVANISQRIEADMIPDFAFGLASAQPITLSFVVWSSLTGNFGASIRNFTNDRSYPFLYNIPVANAWTKIAVTIPGDTAGTWVNNGNVGAMQVTWDVGSGSTWLAPAGVWVTGNFTGVTGQVSLPSTNGANFRLTGVKLEIGSVATPFNRQSLAKSMADCQRYFQTSYIGAAVGSANINGLLSYVVAGAPAGAYWINTPIAIPAMRVSPTATGYSPATGAFGKARDANANVDITCAWAAGGPTTQTVNLTNSASAGGYNFQFHYTFSAEL